MHLLYVIGISHCHTGKGQRNSLSGCSEVPWSCVSVKWELWNALIAEPRIAICYQKKVEAATAWSHSFVESEWFDLYRSVEMFNLT